MTPPLPEIPEGSWVTIEAIEARTLSRHLNFQNNFKRCSTALDTKQAPGPRAVIALVKVSKPDPM